MATAPEHSQAASATVDAPFSRPLPPGVSTANPQERSLQDGRSAAINAAASLASAPVAAAAAASTSEQHQPTRAPSGMLVKDCGASARASVLFLLTIV